MYIANDKPFYNINQVSEILNFSADRLRTYDEEGLIVPYRMKKGNKRLYSAIDIEWLQACRTLIKDKKITVYSLKIMLVLISKIQDNHAEELRSFDTDVINMIIDLKKNPNYQKVVKNIKI